MTTLTDPRLPSHRPVDGPKTPDRLEFSARQQRAVEELGRLRLKAPSRVANASRNAQAGLDRRRRWGPARDALWGFLAPHLDVGARVAIVGAGNGDDLPLRRIARGAGEVVLIDLDPGAARGARRRLGRTVRRKVAVVGHDVTEGAADRVVLSALHEIAAPPAGGPQTRSASPSATAPRDRSAPLVLDGALPGAPYDLIVGDLFYSQILYPALLDLGVDPDLRDAALARHSPSLTRAVVARLHASAPRVIHLHDPLAWWDGHEQPVGFDEILALATTDGADASLALAARGNGPHESDPRAALRELGLHPTDTALWRWPFAADVDYLACATLAGTDLADDQLITISRTEAKPSNTPVPASARSEREPVVCSPISSRRLQVP
jgi:hypothetical protein